MNSKTMKIFTIVLDNCGEWMDAREIGYQTDLTSRQVCSVVSRFPSPPLIKERTRECGQTLRVMWNDTPEHSELIKKQLTNRYYGITDEMYERVDKLLSPAGWLSMYDICDETGYSKEAVAKILQHSEGVIAEMCGNTTHYSKIADRI